MKCKTLIFLIFIFFNCLTYGQRTISLYQYFDGKDTNTYNSIIIERDTNSARVWQIGRPQKVIFNRAATAPNAILTDTLKDVPVNDSSSFGFNYTPNGLYGIQAIQWKQKIDMQRHKQGCIVEFSLDGKKTWQNAMNNPYVYKFYGFDTSNVDTLKPGVYAFSGTDTSWRDIWLCVENSFIWQYKSVDIRFKIITDSVNHHKEGWMIDNLISHLTILHTAIPELEKQAEYLKVYPSLTSGRLNIEAQKLQEFHIIKSMQLIDTHGKIVEQFGTSPTRFYININNHPDGIYYLKVNTNLKSETFKVILNKQL